MICEECGTFFQPEDTTLCPSCGWDMYDDGTDDFYYEDEDFWDEEEELI